MNTNLRPLQRPIVIVESPFAPSGGRSIADHLLYLRRALRDSFERGEIPFASHGFFPQFLNEFDPAERAAGIEMGYAFWQYADKVVFYSDYGFSSGMNAALARVKANSDLYEHSFEMRSIGVNPVVDPLKGPL